MIKLPQVEPDLGDLEIPYRKAFLASDASQAIFVIVLSNLASLALIRSDYDSFGLEPKFFIFLAARIGVFIVSSLSILVLERSTHPKLHDWAVTSYMIAGVIINIYINAVTSPSYITYIGVSTFLLNIYYFAFFSPLFARTTISYFFSAVVTCQAYQSQFGQEMGSATLGMLLITNIIGTVISAKLYTHRRINYKAQMDEKELQIQLNKLASTDPLTNAWNRRKFTTEAIREFERAERYKRPLSLILIDIDRLKTINDTYGHLMGDETIRHCVDIVNTQIRGQDILGRLGGDEFGILLPETQLSDAITLGKRIQENSKQQAVMLNGNKRYITFSMGVAELNRDDQSYDDFFSRADKVLYHAKESGRNQIASTESDT